jgi:hypothetical protein
LERQNEQKRALNNIGSVGDFWKQTNAFDADQLLANGGIA